MAVYDSSANDIENAFTKTEIVPDILQVAPKKIVNVSYSTGVNVTLGNELTPTQVQNQPNVSWEAEQGAYYTLYMTDPDAISRTIHIFREVRHWLVMNIPESSVENGNVITEYAGSGPPVGTGLHRYIFLVYKQPNGVIDLTMEPEASKMKHRLRTSVSEFSKKHNLENPIFGNFFLSKYDGHCCCL